MSSAHAAAAAAPAASTVTQTQQMKDSVAHVLGQRSKSRFFVRMCCISERMAKLWSRAIIVVGLLYFLYLQVMLMVNSYTTPSKALVVKQLSSMTLPGLLICAASVDFTTNAAYTPAKTNLFYGDQRIALRPVFDPTLGAGTAGSGDFPLSKTRSLPRACCLTDAVDFMGACWQTKPACPVVARWRPKITGQTPQIIPAPPGGALASWSIMLDCLDYAPGLTFDRPQQSLWLPYMIVTDLGVLAFSNSTGGLSTRIVPSTDTIYSAFTAQYVYWPNKLVIISYDAAEANANPIDIFYGKFDAANGAQNRLRLDLELTQVTLQFAFYKYIDKNGNMVAASSGRMLSYSVAVPPLPWASRQSTWNFHRNQTSTLAWTHIVPNFFESDIVETVLFTYINLITTVLSIIGASEAIIDYLIGPGLYNPKGLINKIFFKDVPTLKATKSDVVIDKKKLAAAAKAREAELLELKEKDRLKNQQAVLANSATKAKIVADMTALETARERVRDSSSGNMSVSPSTVNLGKASERKKSKVPAPPPPPPAPVEVVDMNEIEMATADEAPPPPQMEEYAYEYEQQYEQQEYQHEFQANGDGNFSSSSSSGGGDDAAFVAANESDEKWDGVTLTINPLANAQWDK